MGGGVRGGTTAADWQPLIARWGGGSWSTVPAPSLGSPSTGELRAVAALDGSTAFAVGSTSSPSTNWFDQPLILRWDGSIWTRMAVPTLSGIAVLTGVAARSSSDVWAVGYVLESNWRTLILRWNGSTWTRIASPNDGPYGNVLNDVTVISANDAWAVGSSHNGGRTLTMRWDGTAWRQVASPASDVPLTTSSSLSEVATTGPTDVWAVGVGVRPYVAICDCYSPPAIYTLVLHWNGQAWSVVPSPNASAAARPQSTLAGVASAPGAAPLAVGDQLMSDGTRRALGTRYTE